MDTTIMNAAPEAGRISPGVLTILLKQILKYMPTAIAVAVLGLYYIHLSHSI